MSVKEIYEANIKDHCYIHLADFNSYDDVSVNMIWEGFIEDIPSEYFDYEVIKTGQSLKDLEQGKNGYYVYVISK